MILICFHRMGPYHRARLEAASSEIRQLTALEWSGTDQTYAWNPVDQDLPFSKITLFRDQDADRLSARNIYSALVELLADNPPECMIINGWGFPTSLAAIRFCRKKHIPAVVMSESTPWDFTRNPLQEWVKTQIVAGYSAALVGGQSHRNYLKQLKFSEQQIFLGYDAVDNGYFFQQSRLSQDEENASRKDLQLPRPFFLASGRFIEKKNHLMLIEAYAAYRKEWESGKVEGGGRKTEDGERRTEGGGQKVMDKKLKTGQPSEALAKEDPTSDLRLPISDFRSPTSDPRPPTSDPWDLVILGDGPLRPDMEKRIHELELEAWVHLPGFKQYDELPKYYALASAFLHPSTSEQWGLVVNEAMASELPVGVSHRCGCAADLVQPEENGFSLDPENPRAWTEAMIQLTAMPESERQLLGNKSWEIIQHWGPERFAQGLKAAVEKAMEVKPQKTGWSARLILEVCFWLKRGNSGPGK